MTESGAVAAIDSIIAMEIGYKTKSFFFSTHSFLLLWSIVVGLCILLIHLSIQKEIGFDYGIPYHIILWVAGGYDIGFRWISDSRKRLN
jgi:hypothetical protein